MPEDMPEDMPDRMPNRMSEDMSDRMPEDVPVRTCINVMVGMTRSKVIAFFSRFLSFFFLEDGDGRKKINPQIHKKAIVIGNQMINYWMFQHFPIIFPAFSSIFPWIFPWIFRLGIARWIKADHMEGYCVCSCLSSESKQWTARDFHRD